jgi:hypothetical protein
LGPSWQSKHFKKGDIMSIGSFLSTLKQDALKFENVVIKDEQAVVKWAESVFGKGNVDNAVATIDAAARTELGALTKKFVLVAEDVLGASAGTAKASLVAQWVGIAATALGIPFTGSAINALLNIFAPFVAARVGAELDRVLQPPPVTPSPAP